MTNEIREQQEVDLNVLWRGLKRRWQFILGSALLLMLISYAWSARQPAVYQASSNLIAANVQSQPQDAVFGNASVKAPPLPEGALAQALQSTPVIQDVIQNVRQTPDIPQEEKARLISALTGELSAQRLRTLSLTARLDNYGNGIYTVRASARTPAAARTLANVSAKALLNWDVNRALQQIKRAQTGFRAQLQQIDTQLDATTNRVERETLIARRATLEGNLAQVNILEVSANGVLSPLSDAVTPGRAVAPKPLRNAVLAGVLGLLLAISISALLTVTDRTIRLEDDLLPLGLPTLGVLPRLRQRSTLMLGIVRAARQSGSYEALGFLRVNLMTLLKDKNRPIVMVTSTAPGEGKTSTTATLADGFASNGQRVLIVDADLRRGTQENVWRKFNDQGQWQQLVGQGGARTTPEALTSPENVQVLEVAPNISLLPAGRGVQDSLGVLNRADIGHALTLWRQQFDIVLIDSAPLLALVDGLVLGKHADGVLLVVEHGQTKMTAIRSALRRAEHAGVNLLGFIINKSNADDSAYSYGYGYSYEPNSTETQKT
ncbi:polysaccharide biosynthesis tyrosine autokinase [Deinococcus fonticola]|uniref:polysaccharide biosynthesis tyrosine autokinase n=1 Tax=Deinococcus fonticola TaxID=2528713 RepID=UPI00107551AD|nr:polysaccharide biosynthesis tyrosine autokinase [Deinococcus fonticola]